MPTTIRICATKTEIAECLRLVHLAYTLAALEHVRCDQCERKPNCRGIYECTQERRTAWHSSPDTAVVRADVDGVLAATVTCAFEDPQIGLPCSVLFSDRLQQLPFDRGAKLGEVTCLAASPDRSYVRVTRNMLEWARDWMFAQGCVAVVGCCHPLAVPFWKRHMGGVFPDSQDIRSAKHVAGQPAVFGYMTPESVEACRSSRRRSTGE